MSRVVPSYRRHPNGQAFVQRNNKRTYLGKHGSPESLQKYQAFLAGIAAEHQCQSAGPDQKHLAPAITGTTIIARLIDAYLDYAIAYYSRDGEPTKEYKGTLSAMRSLDSLYGAMAGFKFGPVHLEQLQDRLVAQGYARRGINHRIRRVKLFFRWCCRKGHIPAEVFGRLACVPGLRKGRTSARETSAIKPPDAGVVEATIPYLTPVVAAMVRVHRICGMRSEEVCLMRPCDIDRSRDIWLYWPSHHKNVDLDHVRVVAIPRAAQAILKPFLDREDEAWLFSPVESELWRLENRPSYQGRSRTTKVYPSELRKREELKAKRRAKAKSRTGGQYDPVSYWRSIRYAMIRQSQQAERDSGQRPTRPAKGVRLKPWLAERGVTYWHPHQLRHAASTEIAEAIGQQAAQRWLGHAHLSTTSIYTEKQVSELVTIARSMDRIWSHRMPAEEPPGDHQSA